MHRPPVIHTDPLLSADIGDLLTPAAVIEADGEDADKLGAFAETALSESEAWDAKDELPVS